ncbi:MAG TPA: glutamine-hydrolyzing GMP synthase, partial [Kiritimatiellae bacterium]|nr:glutamine-hydrolyzing GMP synthase [Kiritimatiellia bacterium]
MKAREWIAVLDFGSQYTQLIARRIRELGVFSELVRFDIGAGELKERCPAGIVLSGGPASVRDENTPRCDPGIFSSGVPVLGICYGMQLMGEALGGRVEQGRMREYGPARVRVLESDVLFRGLPREIEVWMSHGDRISEPPPGFKVLAATEGCPVAAMGDDRRGFFGLQFHPEVAHTPRGREILHRFLYAVCGCRGDWSMPDFIREAVEEIRLRVGDERVLCALSGGVDSAVTAALVHRAV